MLTDLAARLCSLLGSSGTPVYLADSVPACAEFPYVTLQFSPPLTPGDLASLTLTGWHWSHTGNADRFALADALLTLIPPAGLKLPLENGTAVIWRSRGRKVEGVRSGDALGLSIPFDLMLLPSR